MVTGFTSPGLTPSIDQLAFDFFFWPYVVSVACPTATINRVLCIDINNAVPISFAPNMKGAASNRNSRLNCGRSEKQCSRLIKLTHTLKLVFQNNYTNLSYGASGIRK